MAYRESTRHRSNADGSVAAAMMIWSCHQLPDWMEIWAGCLRRIHSWRVPPHWSARDWSEEMQAHCAAAAVQAVCEYDGTRGIPLSSFVRWRMTAGALTRSRQEWGYALRSGADPDRPARSIGDAPPLDEVHESVRFELTGLSDSDRELIERVFWEGWTEAEAAAAMGRSQSWVNQRKRWILAELRRRLSAPGK